MASPAAFFRRYGKIALSLAVIFLSGQAVGWMLASSHCLGRHSPQAEDNRAWTSEMLARLRSDLELTPAQAEEVEPKLHAVAAEMQHERDRAMFQIHVKLLKLHDDLAASVTAEQKEKLDRSRQNLLQSIRRKYPGFLTDPAP